MSIKALLKQKVEDKVIHVEHEGCTYEVKGRPDAALLTRCQAIEEKQIAKQCKHFSTMTGRKVDPHSYRNILLVHNTLVPEDSEEPYTELQMAELCVNHGVLFTKLLGAAMDVLGLLEAAKNDDDTKDPIAEMAVKN